MAKSSLLSPSGRGSGRGAETRLMERTARAVGQAFDETRLLQPARDSSPGKFHYKCMHFRYSVDP